jgi:hypothetical protein
MSYRGPQVPAHTTVLDFGLPIAHLNSIRAASTRPFLLTPIVKKAQVR